MLAVHNQQHAHLNEALLVRCLEFFLYHLRGEQLCVPEQHLLGTKGYTPSGTAGATPSILDVLMRHCLQLHGHWPDSLSCASPARGKCFHNQQHPIRVAKHQIDNPEHPNPQHSITLWVQGPNTLVSGISEIEMVARGLGTYTTVKYLGSWGEPLNSKSGSRPLQRLFAFGIQTCFSNPMRDLPNTLILNFREGF